MTGRAARRSQAAPPRWAQWALVVGVAVLGASLWLWAGWMIAVMLTVGGVD